eukprot:CAMPEP_0118818464 /NCGR_PEP_ID=MMETSP1162-20130426/6194_1 /TAXON_ID=33656 /ORGANISM="Phaeocystis Sp, Strain CCMP2710" /LENGTH=221 /DNA_ID=CAMNT_0006748669 /DNA_START=103 /DNA_END=768 /DNA_ORIENTATION=-
MSGALIEAVVKSLQSTFHPMQVLKGGSAGKNTDVPGSDIDLVVILQDYDYSQLGSYRRHALQGLRTSASIANVKIERDIKVGISVVVSTVDDSRSVDLLFTGDPDLNAHDNPPFCYNCFSALDQCKHVKQAKETYPLLHENIIKFKLAAFEQRKGVANVKCPSYFIELLIIKDFKENGQVPDPATVYRRQRGVYELRCPVTGAILDIPEGKSRDWWNALQL